MDHPFLLKDEDGKCHYKLCIDCRERKPIRREFPFCESCRQVRADRYDEMCEEIEVLD